MASATATKPKVVPTINKAPKSELDKIRRVLEIFKASKSAIRPHFTVVGPSGSGKTHTLRTLCEMLDLEYMEVNAAQLTKEGTSGNSLSKALSPIINKTGKQILCFVDEFDKLFISGNNNSSIAHETTLGVQNEFLKVLESNHASVYGDYGKYVNVPVDKVLFVFAGAFNGEENITLDRMRDFGVKTEFLGRVGLIFNLRKLSLEELVSILRESCLLSAYLKLFPEVAREKVVGEISRHIETNYENNTIGARIITTLIHAYFINDGKLTVEEVAHSTFQSKLSFGSDLDDLG